VLLHEVIAHAVRMSAYVHLGYNRTCRTICLSSRMSYVLGRLERGRDLPSIRKGSRVRVLSIVDSGIL
jgi:hypothetical protein